jgi:predicted transport protein
MSQKITPSITAVLCRVLRGGNSGLFPGYKSVNFLYKHGKNFLVVHLQTRLLQIWLDIKAEELENPYQLAWDVENIGHYGTGDVEVRLSDLKDLDKVMALVEQSYKQTV